MQNKWVPVVAMVTVLVLLGGAVPISAAPGESGHRSPGESGHRSGIIHIVQRGETMYSIARRYGVSMWTIARANGITNPNHIYVGQRLVIPTRRPAGAVHIVQPGEILTRIAQRYGVDVWTLAQANNITNLNRIYVGQRLVIPGAAPPPVSPTQRPPQPTQPVTWPGPWSGEYFDNVTLAGSPYATRQDETINFNWGWGPPSGGMPVNSFSVRWTGTFHFAEGTYRFYAKVDDGVRVYVDGERVINGWRDGGLRTYTADRSLGAGDHILQVEYYDRIQVARVYVWYKQLTGPTPTPGPTPTSGPTPTPGSTLTPTPGPTATPAPDSGWLGEYYNNEDLTGSPVAVGHYPWIGFEWGTGSPMSGVREDYFSARWTTRMTLNTDHYRFCARADDGVRVWVDGQLVVDEWHLAEQGSAYWDAHCGSIWAETGAHDVKVEFFEHDGDALIYVWWEPH